jgi:peroxiredoxin
VAWAGDESSFQAFVDRHGLTFPQLSDPDGELYAHFGIVAQPAFVVIDPTGRTTTMLGALDRDELDGALTNATSESPRRWNGW